jgi:hypothetical protein
MRPSISKNDARDYTFGEPIRKLVTFANSTGVLDLFAVTGRVIVRIVPVCTTVVASAAGANLRLGTAFDDDAMIADTLSTLLGAEEIWIDTSPDSRVEPLSAMREYMVTNGDAIQLTLSAQVDTGAIEFLCYWAPVSLNGNVVPA